MEDHRGRFCAILAGYKDEMKSMLGSNPGLESRIQFTLEFPDYSREELGEIAVRFLENKIELQAVILLELTKHLLKVLPNRPSVNQEVADLEYLKFLDDVELALKQNHGGKLEAMVLDIYSDQLSKGGNK
jgi:hypothetical protein